MSELESVLTGGVAGVAIGEAASAALDPVFEPVKQDAWFNAAKKILDADQLAELVATALLETDAAATEAQHSGYSAVEFNKLVQLALKAPEPAEAEKLWLRNQGGYPGSITQDLLYHAYAKAGIEYQYWEAMKLAGDNALLTPAQLALGVVRSTVPDAGLLVVNLDTSDSNVPQYPIAALDTLKEFAAYGLSPDRARALVGEIGLPLSVISAAQAEYRGIITKGAYYQAVLEGDVRPEWADTYYEYARQIPTAHDGIEMRLRNYFTTDQEMYDFTARHGMSEADTDVLFRVTGRPLSWHQTWTGTQRGGALGGPIDMIDPAFLDSLRKSNIRPEYYNLAWYDRNPVPAAFMVRQWLKDGGSTDQARQWLTASGWLTPDIDAIITEYAPTTGSAKKLTVAQIKAAYKAGNLKPADALTQIEAYGYSADDANLLLGLTTTAAPPPVPSDAEIEALVAQGYTVTRPPLPANAVAEALEANGYTVIAPPPQPYEPTVAPPQGG